MYDDLVKRLRDKAGGLDYDGWVDTAAILEEAANTIEKLIEVIQNHDFLESLMKPEWIPVTERLPEEDGYYLVCCQPYKAQWVTMQHYSPDSALSGSVTYWMPIPEPPKEET